MSNTVCGVNCNFTLQSLSQQIKTVNIFDKNKASSVGLSPCSESLQSGI